MDEKQLSDIHKALAEELLKRIKSGEATAADLGVARQFLRDNNIDQYATKGSAIASLADVLPFTGTDD